METDASMATIEDIADNVELRKLIFVDMVYDENEVNEFDDIFRQDFSRSIPNEDYYGWVIDYDNNMASTFCH